MYGSLSFANGIDLRIFLSQVQRSLQVSHARQKVSLQMHFESIFQLSPKAISRFTMRMIAGADSGK